MFRQISSGIQLPRNSTDFLHAANLRHGTDGFTSPPKEGVLRIFFITLANVISKLPGDGAEAPIHIGVFVI